ncbi:C40 family peptidase [Cellulophaga sp. HaHaR_3_176]|uniref:C40 family peptidase n=1 Tax=Cellulophaga sp. HaHaR_3_176 TaxID=1942464 RepID=UPI001C1FB3FE|nr:C40 family peptidase [Cellulophaga sp. HaHaR_3_176]QWX84233.1 C40 family peptidase [Cellulophaga sp. HaHaR_3_176]
MKHIFKLTIRVAFVVAFVFLAVSCGGAKKAIETTNKLVVTQPPTELQIKYGKIIGVVPDSIVNKELYSFVDEWMGTPYKMGGETGSGIDCSSFTQLLYSKVYDLYIERTAHKQFKSKELVRFRGVDYLEEGDLIFFQSAANQDGEMDHVGMYLSNNKFVHSSSYKGQNKTGGVQIGDIRDQHWVRRFVAAGKRKDFQDKYGK